MPPALSIVDAFAGRELLVTGFTGFLGKVLVSQILYELPAIRRVHVLVRAEDEDEAMARFIRIAARSPAFRPLRERFGEDLGAFLGARVEVHPGDVREPLLGLSRDVVAELAPRLAAVIHVAGLTDFAPDPRRALETNVEGALNAADLVARCDRAILVHTSTCYVAGVRQGRIDEELHPDTPRGRRWDPAAELAHLEALAAHRAPRGASVKAKREARALRVNAATKRAELLGFPNIYTYSKALAEALLVDHGRDNGDQRPVPLTIVRPAIIECARSYPFPGWNEGVTTTAPLLWLAKTWFRHFPLRAEVHFDLVPVDTVTRSMLTITAAALNGSAAPIYQVGTSGSNPLSMDRAVELTNLALRKELAHSPRVSDRLFRRLLDNVLVPADGEHALSPLRLRRVANNLRATLEGLDLDAVIPAPLQGLLGDRLERMKDDAELFLSSSEKQLKRVDKLLEVYRPFVHDNDWIFVNERIRALDQALSDDERARFGFGGDSLAWRDYWIDVLYPGISTWCLPLLDGGEAPEDPALTLELVPPAELPEDGIELSDDDEVAAIIERDAQAHPDHEEHEREQL